MDLVQKNNEVDQPLKSENSNNLQRVDISFKDIRYSVFVKNTDKKKVSDHRGKSKLEDFSLTNNCFQEKKNFLRSF